MMKKSKKYGMIYIKIFSIILIVIAVFFGFLFGSVIAADLFAKNTPYFVALKYTISIVLTFIVWINGQVFIHLYRNIAIIAKNTSEIRAKQLKPKKTNAKNK